MTKQKHINKQKTFKVNVLKRLLKYIKPCWKTMVLSFLLVLFITGLELYRPVLIGGAIDQYINGYSQPYAEVGEYSKDAIFYNNKYISKTFPSTTKNNLLQLIIYDNKYYLFDDLDLNEQIILKKFDESVIHDIVPTESVLKLNINNETLTGTLMHKDDLKILRTGDFSGIKFVSLIYLLVLGLSFLCNFLQTWMLQLTGQKIIYNIRQEVFQHVHSLSLRFFDINPVGKIVTRITNDVESLSEMYSGILVKLFKNTIKIIGLAIVMISINFKMSMYAFILLPLIIFLTFIFKRISRATYRITRTKITTINTFLSENISGMKLIQIFARENEKYKDFEVKSKELFHANFKEMMVFAIFRPIIYMLSIVSLIIIIISGSASVLQGALSMGTLFIFIQYIGSFFEPIQELAEQLGTLQSAMASAEKIFTVLDEEPQIVQKENPTKLDVISGKIEFKNVWFAYENEEYILRDVSFTINPGEKVAFVGATGAGKSSILNLIGRYYDIQKGEILIDGINIKDLDKDQLRGSIGQVQQDVFIFTGDIKSNIRLRNDEITETQINQAASYVNAKTFIEKLPNAYNEKVTERGSTLSQGQRQLLSFARTLAFHPRILVMDEATANIDTETELLIQEAIQKLMDDRTTIMVAHRLSTIQHADNIIVMHKGKIREAGTHQELLNLDGIYKKLYQLQLNKL
jgi:ATP-binding cassette subfamily B protein